MSAFTTEHLEYAKTIQATIRNRPKNATAMNTLAQTLALFEAGIVNRCAALADVIAEYEKFKGAGTLLLQQRGGEGAPTEADVKVYINRHNLAKDIAGAIRAGKWPDEITDWVSRLQTPVMQ